MENDKPLKIEFAPGAFDNFDGTQEELNEFMAEIHRLASTGELFENSRQINLDELDPEADAEFIKFLADKNNNSERKLQ